MEEEQGEDSEVLDAMDGWDSEEETAGIGGTAAAAPENNNNTNISNEAGPLKNSTPADAKPKEEEKKE